jgi:hypothetical protein
MKRRDFIKTSAVGIGGLYLANKSYAQAHPESKDKKLPRRVLGKTGEKLSIIGFGGIVVKDVEPEFASDVVARSVA